MDLGLAGVIVDLMEKFAGYGFNKFHSAASPQLPDGLAQAHHPAAFMAAVLSADMDHTGKIVLLIDECRRMGLPILSPYVNEDPRQVRHRARDPRPPSGAGGAPGHPGRTGVPRQFLPATLALGKDIGGKPVAVDLAKMPYLLVAGTTGAGKSVALNAMILSMLYKAMLRDVRLIMIDPKMLELSVYDGIPVSGVERRLKIGYNRAARMVEEMERQGVVGSLQSNGFREVLVRPPPAD